MSDATDKPMLVQMVAAAVRVCQQNGAEDVLIVACAAWDSKEAFDSSTAMVGAPEKIAIALYDLLRANFSPTLRCRLGHALLSGDPLDPLEQQPAPAEGAEPDPKEKWRIN